MAQAKKKVGIERDPGTTDNPPISFGKIQKAIVRINRISQELDQVRAILLEASRPVKTGGKKTPKKAYKKS